MNEKLTAYALNELPPEERAALEAQMKNDPKLREEAEEMKVFCAMLDQEMHAGIDEDTLKPEQRTKLVQSFQTVHAERKVVRPLLWRRPAVLSGLGLAAAACVAVLLTVHEAPDALQRQFALTSNKEEGKNAAPENPVVKAKIEKDVLAPIAPSSPVPAEPQHPEKVNVKMAEVEKTKREAGTQKLELTQANPFAAGPTKAAPSDEALRHSVAVATPSAPPAPMPTPTAAPAPPKPSSPAMKLAPEQKQLSVANDKRAERAAAEVPSVVALTKSGNGTAQLSAAPTDLNKTTLGRGYTATKETTANPSGSFAAGGGSNSLPGGTVLGSDKNALVLTGGVNTYSGSTTVNAGTLTVPAQSTETSISPAPGGNAYVTGSGVVMPHTDTKSIMEPLYGSPDELYFLQSHTTGGLDLALKPDPAQSGPGLMPPPAQYAGNAGSNGFINYGERQFGGGDFLQTRRLRLGEDSTVIRGTSSLGRDLYDDQKQYGFAQDNSELAMRGPLAEIAKAPPSPSAATWGSNVGGAAPAAEPDILTFAGTVQSSNNTTVAGTFGRGTATSGTATETLGGNALASSSLRNNNLTVNGTTDANGFSSSVTKVGAGTMVIEGGARYAGAPIDPQPIDGLIVGTGSTVVAIPADKSPVLTLSGNNTYAGGRTIVNGGTVIVTDPNGMVIREKMQNVSSSTLNLGTATAKADSSGSSGSLIASNGGTPNVTTFSTTAAAAPSIQMRTDTRRKGLGDADADGHTNTEEFQKRLRSDPNDAAARDLTRAKMLNTLSVGWDEKAAVQPDASSNGTSTPSLTVNSPISAASTARVPSPAKAAAPTAGFIAGPASSAAPAPTPSILTADADPEGKVPILADIPIAGRLFQAKPTPPEAMAKEREQVVAEVETLKKRIADSSVKMNATVPSEEVNKSAPQEKPVVTKQLPGLAEAPDAAKKPELAQVDKLEAAKDSPARRATLQQIAQLEQRIAQYDVEAEVREAETTEKNPADAEFKAYRKLMNQAEDLKKEVAGLPEKTDEYNAKDGELRAKYRELREFERRINARRMNADRERQLAEEQARQQLLREQREQYLAEQRARQEAANSTATYRHIIENPFQVVARAPLSTFSIDVDTASYSNVRRFLDSRQRPPADAVRLEELVNYFPYPSYVAPKDDTPFSVKVDMATAPWQPLHRIARVAIRGREVKKDQRQAANFTFLLDVSGSMSPPERLPLVKQALRLLVEQLREDDRVSIVTYAGESGLALDSTPGDQKERILHAIDRLNAEGSTNGAGGIRMAYEQAVQHFKKNGINRVILCTDGDFNVGTSNVQELERLIAEKAKTGVFLSVLGVGTDNLHDHTMQTLADRGNGNYHYLDSLSEARKVLVEQMTGTLVTIAKDVKIQVEFNPAQVAAYRLIGYEKRMLAKEDFNNDKKDAGEIGAGHTITALYEIVPASLKYPDGQPVVDDLKYGKPAATEAPAKEALKAEASASKESMTVKLRYKDPNEDTSKLISIPVTDAQKTLSENDKDFQFAVAVASFGMLLRDSPYGTEMNWESVRELAKQGKGRDEEGYRGEFLQLIDKARGLYGNPR